MNRAPYDTFLSAIILGYIADDKFRQLQMAKIIRLVLKINKSLVKILRSAHFLEFSFTKDFAKVTEALSLANKFLKHIVGFIHSIFDIEYTFEEKEEEE